MKITLWPDSLTTPGTELYSALSDMDIDAYARNLESDGWQHTADGPGDTRLYMHTALSACLELIPPTVCLDKR